jgi:BASS family bile acid:Na+ symporter
VDTLGGWYLPASMFGLMFAMGLALHPDDFRRIAKVPGPVVVGTLLQLIGMPILGFGIALAYELPPLLAAGLVIVAACPGGMMSNMLVYLVRANTALSITLTATATTATLLTLPLWIRGILASVGGEAATIEVPILGTALELGGLTVVPVALGMLARQIQPALVRLERPLSSVASIAIVGILLTDGFTRPEPPTEPVAVILVPCLLLGLATAVLGIGLPRLLRLSAPDAAAISVELCMKNGLLGTVVASSSFGVLEPSIPILVYTGMMLPVSATILIAYRVREGRRWGRMPGDVPEPVDPGVPRPPTRTAADPRS